MIDEPIKKQSIIMKYTDEEMKKFFGNLGEKADEIMIKALSEPYVKDEVNNPDHYNKLDAHCAHCEERIECIDVIHSLPFHLANTIKYIWRHEHKGGIESLKKAQWYLNDYIKRMENDNG